MRRFEWDIWSFTLAIIIGAVVLIVILAIGNQMWLNSRMDSHTLLEVDHKLLATEISRLHDDVRILQTQVGPKQ